MNEDLIDYKLLRKIQQEEKSSPRLTKIDDHFFSEASSYSIMLHSRLAQEEKPSRKLIISDQIQQTEQIIKSIYELREKKIIHAAMLKARGGNPSEKLFLEPEKELFSSVYTLLIKNRNMILHDEDTPPEPESKIKTKPMPPQQSSESKEQIEPKKPTSDHTVIRILETIPTFIGTDAKQYTLKQQDIISIPNDLAVMLINKNVAEKVSIDA